MVATRLTPWLGFALFAAVLAAPVPCASDPGDGKEVRLREGTRLHERAGRFVMTNDRIIFYPADKTPESIRVLENLALERVANGIVDPRASNRWLVSGTITEYRGMNYLLISRAIVVREGER